MMGEDGTDSYIVPAQPSISMAMAVYQHHEEVPKGDLQVNDAADADDATAVCLAPMPAS